MFDTQVNVRHPRQDTTAEESGHECQANRYVYADSYVQRAVVMRVLQFELIFTFVPYALLKS